MSGVKVSPPVRNTAGIIADEVIEVEGFTVEISRRMESGKGAAGRYRREGLIPVIIYQKGTASVPGLVPYFQFLHLGEKAKSSQIFYLKSEDKDIDGRSALVRGIQRDYLTGKPIHVDFQALREDEEIEVEVALLFEGESVGVKTEGGIMTMNAHHITVSCLPKDIPTDIRVDVSELHLNQSIHAGEIVLPDRVKLITHAEEPIVSVTAPKAEVVEAAPAEGEAVEGAAEGEAAEGGAAPAGAEKAAPAAAAKGSEKEKK